MVQEGNSVMMSQEEFEELLYYKDRWLKREKQGIKKEMPSELRDQLRQVSLFSACGYIRSYYDPEAPKDYKYADSVMIHNYFAYLEEIADELLDENITGAEELIREYVRVEIEEEEANE